MSKLSKSGLGKICLHKYSYHHLKQYNRLKKKKNNNYLGLTFLMLSLSFYSLYLLIKPISKEAIVMLDSLFTMGYKKNTDFISRSVSSFSPGTLKPY